MDVVQDLQPDVGVQTKLCHDLHQGALSSLRFSSLCCTQVSGQRVIDCAAPSLLWQSGQM